MNLIKNLYLTLLLVLAQRIRPSTDSPINGIDLNGKGLLFCLETERLPLEFKNLPKQIDIELKLVWVIAYLDLRALKLECGNSEQMLTIAKNSLKVVILKNPKDFDEDNDGKLAPYDLYRVQVGELIGAFQNNKDWVSNKKKDRSFFFGPFKEVGWTHQLELAGVDWIWLQRLPAQLKPDKWRPSIDKKPDLKDITIEFDGFKIDSSNPARIKIVDYPKLNLRFTIIRAHSTIKKRWRYS